MSKHLRHSREHNFYKEQNNKKSKKIPIETYEDIEGVTKVIKFLSEKQSFQELKYSKELSQAFKEHGSKCFGLHEESEENGTNERIVKYIESDEAIKENMILFVENRI